MLVLSRKAQEVIHIGDEICVTILRVKGRTVRVGVEAPMALHVRRGELPLDTSARNAAQTRPSRTPRGTAESKPDSEPPIEEKSPSIAFQQRFENWPLTRKQRQELMVLASDA